jgi:hypothetical protein
LPRFELSPTLACRKERILQHSDQAYDTQKYQELGKFVVETVTVNLWFLTLCTLSLNFQFLVLEPGPNDLFLKFLVFKFELLEVEFFPVSGNLGGDSISFFLNLSFSFHDLDRLDFREMVKGIQRLGDSVFGPIPFQELFPFEYFFPEDVPIQLLPTLQPLKARQNIIQGGINDIDVVLNVIDGLK